MKKVLLAGLFTLTGIGANAQNILNNSKFENEVTTVASANKATTGEWFIVNGEPGNATNIVWQQTGDTQYPNVIAIDNTNAQKTIPWYRAFLGQRMAGLEKGIYMLTFYVKVQNANTPLGIYIRQTNNEVSPEGKSCAAFFTRKGYDPTQQQIASGAQHKYIIRKANEWTKVVVYFDTNRVVDSVTSITSYPELKITNADEHPDILNDCYLAIVSPEKGAIVTISNATLERK